MKLKVMVFALFSIMAFASSASEYEQTRQAVQASHPLDNSSVNIWVRKARGGGAYWATFKWKVNTEDGTAYLLPTANGKFISPSQLSDNVVTGTIYTFKIIGKDGKVKKTKDFGTTGALVRDVAFWLANEPLKLGEEGITIDHFAKTQHVSYRGKLANYNNLNLEDTWKSVYTKFAIVPSSDGMLARYLLQDMLDTSKTYFIQPLSNPDQYLNFRENPVVAVTSKSPRQWKLRYNEKKFAYNIIPISPVWGTYNLFWSHPTKNQMTLAPLDNPPNDTNGEFWQFLKGYGDTYGIKPFKAISDALTQTQDDYINLDVGYDYGYSDQRFIIKATSE